jgi:serine/threonine protein kinase
VFEEPPGKFIAKVSDFGYSSMLGDQDSVYLPHTRPWYAPEWHRRAFTLSQAVRMDIFSYGLLCLWILFQDEPLFPSLHDIEALKLEQGLLGLSDQLIATAMPSHNSTRANIASFFRLSLTHSPERRSDGFSTLVQLLSSGDRSG